jgi:hypothetical protein
MADKNFLRAYVSREESGSQAGEPIRFTASTAGIKRDGIDLDMDDWLLDNYHKNPVFLWAHDYWGKNLPLGKVNAEVEGDRLMAEVVFDQNDEFAKAVERKYRDGFLHTVSVGWNFVEVDKKRKMELLDISGVPVPGDPDALMERQYEALKRMFEGEGKETGDGGRGADLEEDNAGARSEQEPEWEKVAAEMVEIFLSPGDESDEVRERRYRALLPKYRRLGKVAPEFLTAEELSALDEKEVSGLFLEGEADGSPRMERGRQLKAESDGRRKTGDGQGQAQPLRAEVEQAIGVLQKVLSRIDGAKVNQEVEGEDGEKDKALLMRAMEEKLKLQMRSLK